jgi:hypothetical protein
VDRPPSTSQLSDIIYILGRIDPNRNQNRIPSQTELATLRSIHSHKRQFADTIKRELELAKEAHERIQSRHDSPVRKLEAAQSELNISHKYLVTLEQQLKTLQEEDHDLAGLHPIRQCPEDVIRIFLNVMITGRNPNCSPLLRRSRMYAGGGVPSQSGSPVCGVKLTFPCRRMIPT